MKEKSIEELKQTLEELYWTQQARLDVGADDLDIREEIAEVEEEIKELQDETIEENSIEEALEKLSNGKKIKMYELLRTFKREGIENFVITRKKYVDVILSEYKKVLKENEELNEKILDNAGIYQLGFKDGKESYIKKVKDKIEELIKEGRHYNANKIEVLQELLESEK